MSGLGVIDSDLDNRGTLSASGPGALTITGDVVNNGIVLDASAVRPSWSVSDTAFTFRIASYSGHNYTIQTSTDLSTGGWTDIETRLGVTGQELVFTHDAGAGSRRFYRIRVQ